MDLLCSYWFPTFSDSTDTAALHALSGGFCPFDNFFTSAGETPSTKEAPLPSSQVRSVMASGSNVAFDNLDFLSLNRPSEVSRMGQGSHLFAPPLALTGNQLTAPPVLERAVRPASSFDMLFVAPGELVHDGAEDTNMVTRTHDHNVRHVHNRAHNLDLDIDHGHSGHVGEVQMIELQACRHTRTAVTRFEISIVHCAECGAFDLVCERLRLNERL